MIRVAAIADVHFSTDSRGRLRDHWSHVHESADVLLIGGDLTTHGERDQARVLAEEIGVVQVPVVIVLGNHDYHSDGQDGVREELERAGALVLESENVTLQINGMTLGSAKAVMNDRMRQCLALVRRQLGADVFEHLTTTIECLVHEPRDARRRRDERRTQLVA